MVESPYGLVGKRKCTNFCQPYNIITFVYSTLSAPTVVLFVGFDDTIIIHYYYCIVLYFSVPYLIMYHNPMKPNHAKPLCNPFLIYKYLETILYKGNYLMVSNIHLLLLYCKRMSDFSRALIGY